MKQIYSILFFTLISTMSFSQTFDWETANRDATSVFQTVSGITATFTTSNNSVSFADAGGFLGSSGVFVFANSETTSVTVSFSSAVDVTSLFGLDGGGQNGGSIWTLTPTGGSNPSVDQFINTFVPGATITLNWTNVNSFTITSSVGDALFGLDNIIISPTLSNNNFNLNSLRIYPNPSSDFITIEGLSEMENYSIYNALGLVVNGKIISRDDKIDVRNLSKGVYYLKFVDGSALKFIKE